MTVDIVVPDRAAVVEVVTAPTAAAVDVALLGPPGPAGATGPAGPKGDTGATGPIGPGAAWTPEDNGLLTWNGDPSTSIGALAPPGAAGTLYVARLNVRAQISVRRIWTLVQTVGAGMVAGQCFMALYRQDLTLIAQSADMSTSWTVLGAREALLSGGPYTVPAGWCYAAMWFNATTAPTFQRFAGTAANSLNLGAGAYRSGVTATPATTTAPASIAGFARHDTLIWMALG